MTNQTLLDSTVRNQIHIEGLKENQVGRVEKFLKRVDKDLRRRLTADDLTEFSRTRMEKLLVEVNKGLKKSFDDFQKGFEKEIISFAEYESEFEAKSLENVTGGEFESVIPSPNQIKSAVFSTPLSVRGADGGKLMTPFLKDWARSDRDYLVNTIRQGYFEGQTNFQIIKALRGTAAAKFSDGALATVNRHAEAIVRTAVQHAASVSRFETWKQNDSVVKGYQWVSTLDSKTSTICRTLDGQTFKLDKGPVPPAHIRCRSTSIATLDSKFDFLDEGRTRSARGPDGKTSSTKADQGYYDWLKKQPVEFQDDVLGPVRGKLFREGGLTNDQFRRLQLDKRFRPLSLDEMRKREPLAFKKAFGGSTSAPKVTTKGPFKKGEAANWHNSAFADSRQEMIKVIEKTQDISIDKTPTKTAYARGGKAINMNKAKFTTKRGQNTWRHEVGHIIDHRAGLINKEQDFDIERYASSQRRFLLQWEKDRKALVKATGRGRPSKKLRSDYEKQLKAYNDVEDLIKSSRGVKEGKDRLRRLAEKAGLDFDKFEKSVEKLSDINSGTIGGRARLAKMIEAYRYKNAEMFYDFITFNDRMKVLLPEYNKARLAYRATPIPSLRAVAERLYEEVKALERTHNSILKKDGVLSSFSDLIGSCTKNRVCRFPDYPGHSDDYYDQAKFFGPTESFANLTAIYGNPDQYLWEFLSEFVPNQKTVYLRILDEYL